MYYRPGDLSKGSYSNIAKKKKMAWITFAGQPNAGNSEGLDSRNNFKVKTLGLIILIDLFDL